MSPWLRDEALTCFRSGARHRSPWPRAMAFATLGAAEVLNRYPDHDAARALLKAGGNPAARPHPDPRWPWPEPRLGYANAVLAETLIVAGRHQHDDTLAIDGLRLLQWLLHTETRDGHLSLTPAGGWRPPEPCPAFDQQPIEAAALGRRLRTGGSSHGRRELGDRCQALRLLVPGRQRPEGTDDGCRHRRWLRRTDRRRDSSNYPSNSFARSPQKSRRCSSGSPTYRRRAGPVTLAGATSRHADAGGMGTRSVQHRRRPRPRR